MLDHIIKESLRNQKREVSLNPKNIPLNYHLTLSDRSIIHPLTVNTAMIEKTNQLTANENNPLRKSKILFDWMIDNITYGQKKTKAGYRHAAEVFSAREGICGEMAYLYTTMARLASLKSSIVDVSYDYAGQKVHHGCSLVRLPQKDIYVDIAYDMFDVHHQKFQVLTDQQMMTQLENWR